MQSILFDCISLTHQPFLFKWKHYNQHSINIKIDYNALKNFDSIHDKSKIFSSDTINDFKIIHNYNFFAQNKVDLYERIYK